MSPSLRKVALYSRCSVEPSGITLLSPNMGTLGTIPYRICTSSCTYWALIAVGISMRGIFPEADQLQGLAMTTAEKLLCMVDPMEHISRALMPNESTSWVCCWWRWLDGALMRYEAGHPGLWFWGFLGGIDWDQLLLYTTQGQMAWAEKQSVNDCYLYWIWKGPGEIKL